MLRKPPIRTVPGSNVPSGLATPAPAPVSLRPPAPPAPQESKARTIILAVTLGVLVIVLVAFIFYRRTEDAAPASTATAVETGEEVTVPTAELVARIQNHIVTKTNEQPTVAVVENPDTLQTTYPDLFAYAKVGDHLVVWSDKAVLYSASLDKLLAVVPIRPTTAAAVVSTPATSTTAVATTSTTASVTEEGTPTVEVRNGTRTTGLAQRVSDMLKQADFSMTAVSTARPAEKTFIVVKTQGAFPVATQKLQQLVGGEIVAELPVGEAPMKGDVLVILGPDYQQ